MAKSKIPHQEQHRTRNSFRLPNCHRGSVMLEAAIALPIFFIFVLGTLELSFALRGYVSVSRALQMSAHRLAAVSSMDDSRGWSAITEDGCMEIAGDVFFREASRAGRSVDEITVGERDDQPYVITGFPYDFSDGLPLAPRVYELQTVYRQSCILCNFIGISVDLRLSALAIMETARGCSQSSSSNTMAAGFFPDRPEGGRVRQVARLGSNH